MMMKNNLYLLIEKLMHVIERLPDEIYVKQQTLLFQGSIGQHCRHVCEFFEQFTKFNGDGLLSYDERNRDIRLEESRDDILIKLTEVRIELMNQHLPDKFLLIHQLDKENKFTIQTTKEREYLFLIDHTIHHLAIIRMGIHNLLPQFELPADFGYTTSTILTKGHILS
jgi:uncharacterized damage-inducible protein DinB